MWPCISLDLHSLGRNPLHTPKHMKKLRLKKGEALARSGHIARLRVQSSLGVYTGGNQSMFLSHIGVSLSLSLSLFPLPFLSKINKSMSSGED